MEARLRLHLLHVLAILLVIVAVPAAGVVVGRESAVLRLRELQWDSSSAGKIVDRRGQYAEADHAEKTKGEPKKEAAARTTNTVVLELKHHLLTAIPSHPTAQERYLRRLLAADEARANSFQLRNRHNIPASSTQSSAKPSPASSSATATASVPLTSGIRFQTLNYVTTISLGGGGGNLTVIVDTGSDLTWVQCKPCSVCYAQHDPLFDPSSSASFAAVPCNASSCSSSLKAATGLPGSCSSSAGERCYYSLSYGDGSFSRGVLATDTVSLGGAGAASVAVDGFVFGCGMSNRGLFGGTAGLMGLGRTELSLVSQTASRFGGVFSYCLPATTSAAGSLSLGSGGGYATPVSYTRMIADPAQPPFYFVNVTGASVAGADVAASGAVLGSANVLVDSGTVITRLAPSVYRAVRAEFARQFAAASYPPAPPFSLLDTCYNLTGHDEVKVPLLTLRLEGGADLTVDAAGMLFMVRKDGSQVCLAMASLSFEDQTPIIGNYQQKNKRVVYDTVGSRIGFADEDCSYA
uniref:Peptidase A1 domain-containing protein n=1 Tax=Leersia perrieri TaxID=77586 RepID=A0A0D9X629_9ORYZ